ncbi:MAG TPA: hypothetical protein VED17_01120 [Nitrososphaerales archaeon]|nr:hypothetical protein [Nitrososphaerales archaeon]
MSSPQPATSPPPDQDESTNPDIRQQVDQGRGFLKKLQMMVPGLRGYRSKEDIRVADDMLRNQVSDKIDLAKSNLENLRKQMVVAGDFNNLTTVGSLISQFQQFSGEVRHSQQGYSGFAASFSFDDARLNKLYEYDYDFVNAGMALLNNTMPPNLTYDPTNPASVQPQLQRLQSLVSDFKIKWGQRIEAVENILQAH